MSEWDGFRFELRFDRAAVRDEIVNIEAYRLAISKLYLPAEWKGELNRLHIVRAVRGTTAIEGNPLDEDEVARELARRRRPRAQDQIQLQVINSRQAFRWVEGEFQPPRELRMDDVCSIHRMLTEGSDERDNRPGHLRESGHNVTVGSPQLGGVHRAPPGGEVTQRLVREFLRFVNSREFRGENVVIQALAAHFWFVTLHPFGDGNGRCTRCIEAAFLFGGGYNVHGFYSLSNYFYRHRDEYFRLLQETRTRHRYDLTAFLSFGLRGFADELERINSYIRNRTHRLQFRELIRRCMEKRVGARRRLLNAREAKLLHVILDLSRPPDPFGDEPPRTASLQEVFNAARDIYAGHTERTLVRELERLSREGFVHFNRKNGGWDVLIRFDAIERY